jgi:hypothetical protein
MRCLIKLFLILFFSCGALAFSKHQYVAVGSQNTFLSSTDGVNWINVKPQKASMANSVVYGANKFVAAGFEGAITVSSDGVNWINTSPGATGTLRAICYGNNGFVTVGDDIILTSVDGVDWERINPKTNTIVILSSIVYAKNQYVAVGAHNFIITSPDAKNWTIRMGWPPPTSNVFDFESITFGNAFVDSIYVAIGNNHDGISNGAIFTSADGIVWDCQPFKTSNAFFSITHVGVIMANGANRFLAVGGNVALISKDTYPLSWDTHSIPST